MFTRSSGTTDTSTADTSTADTSPLIGTRGSSYSDSKHKTLIYDQQAEGGLRNYNTNDYGGSAGGLHYIGESFRMPT